MLNRILIFAFLILISFSCGDDQDESNEMEMDCESSVSATVDGSAISFGSPLSATLVDLNFESGSELLIAWVDNERTLNLQAMINETGVSCFPEGRIQLKSLPSNISLLSFQYTEGLSVLSSVSNVFLEDGGDGWLEITSCDGEADVVSVEFEFDAVTTSGDIVQVRSGVSEDVCFLRSK